MVIPETVIQFIPPSMVCMIVPIEPTTQPLSGSLNETSRIQKFVFRLIGFGTEVFPVFTAVLGNQY